jgi:ribonuclease R
LARRIGGRKRGDGGAAAEGPVETGNGRRPSRDDILKFIAENPDRSGKREIAKAFSLRGDDRVWLKHELQELEDEGLLEKRRKRLIRPGALPHVLVLEIIARDADGDLLARPADPQVGNGQSVLIRRGKASRGAPTAGIGDRVLARIFPSDDETSGPAHTARIMKVLEHQKTTVLGVFRIAENGQLRIDPVERKQSELVVEPEFRNGAEPGDLVEAEQVIVRRATACRAARSSPVLGSLTARRRSR